MTRSMPLGRWVEDQNGRARSAGSIWRSRAPMRLSFAGGGTDFPHWFDERPGAVLCSTIDSYASVTLYPREDDEVQINSVTYGRTVSYQLKDAVVYNGALDLAKAAIHHLGARRGMTLDVRSDAPPGSGLGGSSAMVAAVLGAVAAHTDQKLDAYELAELNYYIERKDLNIAGGKQDQFATTFGGFNLIEFHPDRVVVNPLRIDRNVLNDLESHLIMCYTGQVRTDLGLISQQIDLYKEGRQATHRGMQRLYELVFEMKEALLMGRLDSFGEQLHEAYIQKKEMNPAVSAGTLADQLYEEARAKGAAGGKLLGAGGGGYLLLYCDSDRQMEVCRALESHGGKVSSLSFNPYGLEVWRSHCR